VHWGYVMQFAVHRQPHSHKLFEILGFRTSECSASAVFFLNKS